MLKTFDRRLEILRYVQQRGRAKSRELADKFGVSQTTIKKDMSCLCRMGITAHTGRGGCYTYDEPGPCKLSRTEYFVLRNLLREHRDELSPDFTERLQEKLSLLLEDSDAAKK